MFGPFRCASARAASAAASVTSATSAPFAAQVGMPGAGGQAHGRAMDRHGLGHDGAQAPGDGLARAQPGRLDGVQHHAETCIAKARDRVVMAQCGGQSVAASRHHILGRFRAPQVGQPVPTVDLQQDAGAVVAGHACDPVECRQQCLAAGQPVTVPPQRSVSRIGNPGADAVNPIALSASKPGRAKALINERGLQRFHATPSTAISGKSASMSSRPSTWPAPAPIRAIRFDLACAMPRALDHQWPGRTARAIRHL